uniref:uncharacterized protein LOC132660650 n=1 Tax=Panthera onca TaxID=9690 RepID=UPI0029556C46|nr:uncharacterized protein LOC132660650 [Panthera onca]
MDLSSSFFNACLRSKKGEKSRGPTKSRTGEATDPSARHRLLRLWPGFSPGIECSWDACGKGHPQAERVSELCNPNLVRAVEASVPSELCPGSLVEALVGPDWGEESLTFSTSKSRGVKCTQRGFVSASLPQLCHPHSLLLGPGVCPPSQIFHFPATWAASSERTPDFAGVDSRSLPCHLNCKRQGAPLECTEVCPNRPAFNKWTSGVWSEENSHLLTFLPVFWQQLKGSCLLGLSRPRRGNFGVETHASHTDNQWNTSTHADTRTSLAKTHTHDSSPALVIFPQPRPPQPLLPSRLPLVSPPLRLLEKQPHLVNKWHVGEVGI